MSFAENVKRILEGQGQYVIYKRITGSTRNANTQKRTNTTSSTTVKAAVRNYKPNPLTGLVQEGEREVRIAARSLTFTPKQNDIIEIGSKAFQVVSVNTLASKTEDTIHVIRVRGV